MCHNAELGINLISIFPTLQLYSLHIIITTTIRNDHLNNKFNRLEGANIRKFKFAACHLSCHIIQLSETVFLPDTGV